MADFSGECACGRISFRVRGPIGALVHCHCQKCRQWHGAAFRSRVTVNTHNFEWLSGADQLGYYESSDKVTKTFCKHCASPMISIHADRPNLIWVPIGGVEGDINPVHSFHMFVKAKADWYEINDDLPQYSEWPDESSDAYEIMG